MVSPFMPDDEKIAAVREAMPATGAGIYLNAGSAGPLPRESARAMSELADYELSVGRGSEATFLDTIERMAEARAAVAAIVGADIGTVALTHSTTEGMNIGSWGHDWQPGDRAVTTSREHIGGLAPLFALRETRGIEVVVVDVGEGEDDQRTLTAVERAITPRTRLVSLSHVAWATGAVLPIRAVADVAHERGAFVLVDGAQAVGAMPVDITTTGADAYAMPAQKWLLGPEGMGALWVAPAALDRLHPTFGGFFGYEESESAPTFHRFADARRYESGTFHTPSVAGFARSCGWLAMYVGLDWAYRRAAALARRAADALADIPGVRLITPRGRMATLVTMSIDGWPAETALDELGRRTFAIARTVPGTDRLRFSIGFWNTETEIDRVVDMVAELARHTPDTLPARPTLTILGEGG